MSESGNKDLTDMAGYLMREAGAQYKTGLERLAFGELNEKITFQIFKNQLDAYRNLFEYFGIPVLDKSIPSTAIGCGLKVARLLLELPSTETPEGLHKAMRMSTHYLQINERMITALKFAHAVTKARTMSTDNIIDTIDALFA